MTVVKCGEMSGDCGESGRGFQFPECWNNDVRMSALFAPFRSKAVNPTDWNSKMKFWTSLIESWCKFHKCPVVEMSSLKSSFSRKGLVPACLEEVLQHLASTGVIIPKDSFMLQGENWKNWAIKVLLTNPLKWTFNTVKSTIIKEEQKEIFYVHLPVVKARHLSEEIQKGVTKSSQGKMVSFEDLMKWGFDSPESLSVVLHWMQKQGSVGVSEESETTLVKLSKTGTKPVRITETDLGIYGLERQQKLLEENISKLESERNAALEETKRHLGSKMKNMAMISLRRKKELEKTLEKRAVTLENIQAILHKIEQAKLDSEVVESYQKGIATLKRVFKETGLTADTVSGTMDDLEEVLNNRNDIEEALSRPMEPGLEENLEDELNQLLLQDAPEVPGDELPAKHEENKRKDTEEARTRLAALSI